MQGYDLLDTNGGGGGGGDGEDEDSDEEDVFGRTKFNMRGVLSCDSLALEDPQVAARRCAREGKEGKTLARQMFVYRYVKLKDPYEELKVHLRRNDKRQLQPAFFQAKTAWHPHNQTSLHQDMTLTHSPSLAPPRNE